MPRFLAKLLFIGGFGLLAFGLLVWLAAPPTLDDSDFVKN